MTASASLSFELGIRTVSCMATFALRTRVSMSAMGSVMVMDGPLLSPAGLRDAGHLAGVHELPQADATEPELAVDRSRSPAPPAPRVATHLELGFGLLFLDQCLLGHSLALLSFTSEREPEGGEQRSTFG